MTIKAYFKGVEFDLYGEPNKEIAQAELLYLNSLGDPVFTKEGTCFTDAEEQGEHFAIYENGLEVFAE